MNTPNQKAVTAAGNAPRCAAPAQAQHSLEQAANANAAAYDAKYDECERMRARAQRLADALARATEGHACESYGVEGNCYVCEALSEWEQA